MQAIRWLAVLALAARACAQPAQAPREVQVIELTRTTSGWSASSTRGPGVVSPSLPDLWPPALPRDALFYRVFASPPGAPAAGGVIARGLIADPARAVLDPEDDGVTRPHRLLEAGMQKAVTQIRVPAEPPATSIAILRAKGDADPEEVFSASLGGGGSRSAGGARPDPVGGAAHGLEPNRAGILFVAEGYSRDDHDTYRSFDGDTAELVKFVKETKPFDRYFHLLGFGRVDAVSNDDTVSTEEDPPQPDRDTYLGLKLKHGRENGQVLMDGPFVAYPWRQVELPDASWPKLLELGADARRDAIVVIAKTGSGAGTGVALWDGSGSAVVFGTNVGRGPERLVHQLGHALAGLGEEHVSTPPYCRPGEAGRPNTASTGDRAAVGWADLIAAGLLSDPVPGALGCDRSHHRPRATCVMRNADHLPDGFCEACQELLIDAIYARVRLIEFREPADSTVVLDTDAPPTFRVVTNARAGIVLAAEWSLDNTPMDRTATGPGPTFTFTPPRDAWTAGRHVVRLMVRDDTPLTGGGKEIVPRLSSMPHEVRWDVSVRSASGPAGLVRLGTAMRAP